MTWPLMPSRIPSAVPLCGTPQTVKDSISYSPIVAFDIHRPNGDNLSDNGEYIKNLLSTSTKIEASVARSLIKSIVVPDANKDDEDHKGEDGEDDEGEDGEDNEGENDEDDKVQGRGRRG